MDYGVSLNIDFLINLFRVTENISKYVGYCYYL